VVLVEAAATATHLARFDVRSRQLDSRPQMNMIMAESRVDPLAVYAAHSFANDQSYQVSQWPDFREGNLS
jgi:hypothetical protein